MADKLWKLTHRSRLIAINRLPRPYITYHEKPAERLHYPPVKSCNILGYKLDAQRNYVLRRPIFPIDFTQTVLSRERVAYRQIRCLSALPNNVEPEKEGRLTKIKKKVVHEIQHYYHGFRLLFIDLRVSLRYAWKILHGESLTRREHQQLVRSVADLFRLVPFSIFIIVPFMELLLPVFIKLFPGMLPSTFQTSKDKDAKIKQQLDMKLEMAKFLQQTLDDRALKANDGDTHSEGAKKFAIFFKEVRESGAGATNEDILRYSKLFEDEVTLDSMTRQQLVACCKLLELQPLGTNAFLRFQLKARLNALKADDELIRKEGLDCLTLSELQAACRARGMRALGVPNERLRAQLLQWLELSLDERVPPSLLLLSRALYLPENIPTAEQLKATIQSLPEIAATEVRYNIGETEGKVDNRTKLELIEQEELEIKREELQEAVESFRQNYDEELIDLAEEIIGRAAKLKQPSILKIVREKSEANDLTTEFLESIERDLDKLEADIAHARSIEDHEESLKAESKAVRRLSKKVDKMMHKLDKDKEESNHREADAK